MSKAHNRVVFGFSPNRRMLPVCSLLVLALVLGCSPRRIMVDQLAGVVETGLPAYEQESDLVLLAEAFPAHIKLLETVLVSDPGNERLLVLLSRLCGGYAFSILETRWEASAHHQPDPFGRPAAPERLSRRMSRYFQKGVGYALAALERRHPGVRDRLNTPRGLGDLLAGVPARDLPALFWYAYNLGGYIQHNLDSVQALSDAHQVETIMKWVLKTDAGYDHGNAHLVLLVYYGARSPMMGGNPKLAEAHYQAHRRLAPGPDRLGQLFWARYGLVRQGDKAQFSKVLAGLGADPKTGESAGLLDGVARQRAAIYLNAVDDFFDE